MSMFAWCGVGEGVHGLMPGKTVGMPQWSSGDTFAVFSSQITEYVYITIFQKGMSRINILAGYNNSEGQKIKKKK